MNDYDIIIIGAGPAGLTSALYALRANKKVLILEAKCYGGQIINAIKIVNYPGIKLISGADFATNLYNQVKDLGAIIKYETVLSIDKNKKVVTNKNIYNAKAIIIATGAKNRKLKIENEDKYIGKGISYCAVCDGHFYKNKIVAVVGGGNTALTDALYLSNSSKEVYLIHRRDNFKAENKIIDEIKNTKNIKIIYNSVVKKINGDDKLKSITIDNNREEKEINIDCLFIAIGEEANNLIFKNIIDIDKDGYIISKDGVHTNIKNIYVAGDAREKDLRQLTTATSDGSIAAVTAIKELED